MKSLLKIYIGTSFDFDEAINRTNAEVYNEIKKELDKLQKKDLEDDEKKGKGKKVKNYCL